MQPVDCDCMDPKSGSSEDDDALCLQPVIIQITSTVKLYRSLLAWVYKDCGHAYASVHRGRESLTSDHKFLIKVLQN